MKTLETLYDEKNTIDYKRANITDLEDGDMAEIVGQVKISEKEDKHGRPFMVISVRDNTGVVTSIVTPTDKLYKNIKKASDVNGNVAIKGQIKVNGTYKNIKMSYLSKVEMERKDSLYTAEIPSISDLEAELKNRINGIANPVLKSIVQKAFDNNKEDILTAPFSEKTAYAYEGGLMHFTVDMCDMSQSVSSCINCGFWGASTILNEDIMLTGAILGNLGKSKTLRITKTGEIEKTPLGLMEEDSVISRDIVKEAIDDVKEEYKNSGKPINEEEIEKITMELLHIISALKGNVNWGALTTPRSKNAMILSNINNIVYTKGLFENLEKNNGSNIFVKAYDSGKTYYIDEILE